MKEITLERKEKGIDYTIGILTGLSKDFFTIEDTDRGLSQDMDLVKIKQTKKVSITAIPTGRYKIIISYSPRFKCDMPLLVNVKGFDGVRIHWGNKSKDTDGCILVGNGLAKGMITDSRSAYAQVFKEIKDIRDKEELYINIV